MTLKTPILERLAEFCGILILYTIALLIAPKAVAEALIEISRRGDE